MKCDKCVEAGTPSIVYPRGSTSTLMFNNSYYDEEGIYHFHDMNTRAEFYDCSNKHRWQVNRNPECPAGDYGGVIEVKYYDTTI